MPPFRTQLKDSLISCLRKLNIDISEFIHLLESDAVTDAEILFYLDQLYASSTTPKSFQNFLVEELNINSIPNIWVYYGKYMSPDISMVARSDNFKSAKQYVMYFQLNSWLKGVILDLCDNTYLEKHLNLITYVHKINPNLIIVVNTEYNKLIDSMGIPIRYIDCSDDPLKTIQLIK